MQHAAEAAIRGVAPADPVEGNGKYSNELLGFRRAVREPLRESAEKLELV